MGANIHKKFAHLNFSFASNIEQINTLNCDCNLAITNFQIASAIFFESQGAITC